MLTKKYYRMIASCIAISTFEGELIDLLCREFKKDNPQFNEDKFKEACYSRFATTV